MKRVFVEGRFGSNRGGNQEIYVVNADGSTQTRLTNSPNKILDQHPARWVPDMDGIPKRRLGHN